MSCASVHRKMGTHISKVKSLTMDSWTREQVETMKSIGNLKSNARYNPDEIRHPPPTNMIEAERDSDLEKYIRSKYEYKSFMPRSSKVEALLGPSRSSSSRLNTGAAPPRSQTVPAPNASSTTSSTPAPAIAPQPSAPTTPDSNIARTQSQFRSISQPVTTSYPSQPAASQPPPPAQQQQQPPQPSNPVWNDLAQLQAPTMNSTLPLQYASPVNTQPMGIPGGATGLAAPNPYSGLSVSPNAPFPSPLPQQQSPGGMFAGGQPRSVSLSTGMSMNANGMGFGAGPNPGMMSSSQPMLQPQPTLGRLSAPGQMFPQNTTPSPNAFAPQALPQTTGYGIQQQQQQQPQLQRPGAFGQPPFGQPSFLQAQSQPQVQDSPMFAGQQLQFGQGGSPMFQPQMGGLQMQGMTGTGGNPFLQAQQQQQQQFGAPQPPLMGAPFSQLQQQQPMYGQGSAFGGTGWQQPQQQQQWGGGM
ncbi:putative GTPase activating protein for Arf-domain-containing protein [Trametes elegans]|nr:putative GTPase activating protein for Arf-domain-containing protein [Trametes elegans]